MVLFQFGGSADSILETLSLCFCWMDGERVCHPCLEDVLLWYSHIPVWCGMSMMWLAVVVLLLLLFSLF